jgi:uncharacterized membrane protein
VTRLSIIAVHVLALPASVALFILLAILSATFDSREAVDFRVGDTIFVVAHFHATALLVACVLVTTLVAYKHSSLNWFIWAACLLVIVHVVAALVPWLPAGVIQQSSPGTSLRVISSHRGWPDVYVGSALLGLVGTLLGLFVSLYRALRHAGRHEETRKSGG